jgi:hypothetical protein
VCWRSRSSWRPGPQPTPPTWSDTTSPVARTSDSTAPRTPLILAKDDGERRIRRVMGGALAIIKVDRRNSGSPGLMMGYEEIPLGPLV